MALSFDGVDDQVDWGDVDTLDGLSKLTISAWISVNTGQAAFEYILGKEGGTFPALNGFMLYTDAANTTAGVLARNGNIAGGTVAGAITLNTFMHWLYVYDGTGAANADRLKLFLNGTQQTLTFSGTIAATIGATATPLMYSGNQNSQGFATCTIAEVGIWPDVAITDSTIISGLAGGQCPLFYFAQGLRFCDHGRITSREAPADVLQLSTPTITGTGFAAHPPMTHPMRSRAASGLDIAPTRFSGVH